MTAFLGLVPFCDHVRDTGLRPADTAPVTEGGKPAALGGKTRLVVTLAVTAALNVDLLYRFLLQSRGVHAIDFAQ